MNKGYWVVRVSINNAEAFKEYATRAKFAIERFGGKYLVRGGKYFIIEGKHDFERNVIVEFPSIEKPKNVIILMNIKKQNPLEMVRLILTP